MQTAQAQRENLELASDMAKLNRITQLANQAPVEEVTSIREDMAYSPAIVSPKATQHIAKPKPE